MFVGLEQEGIGFGRRSSTFLFSIDFSEMRWGIKDKKREVGSGTQKDQGEEVIGQRQRDQG